jgi:hypothetical protein
MIPKGQTNNCHVNAVLREIAWVHGLEPVAEAGWPMSDLDRRCEKCEQDMEQLRGEVALVIGHVAEVLARVDEVLAKVENSNVRMLADLRAQTEAGFASLQAQINALPLSLSERKDGEPPKLI